MMRILATSDLHGHAGQMAWISSACRQADLLLLGGDLLHEGMGRELVTGWLHRIPCPLVVASGNHDLMLAGSYWLHDLRAPTRIIDGRGQVSGVPICALPWECEDGDWNTRAASRCAATAKMGRPWILVTHALPVSQYEAADFDSEITARLALTGHTHQAAWHGPWINCGYSRSSVPNHAWIDWTSGQCSLHLSDSPRPVRHHLTY